MAKAKTATPARSATTKAPTKDAGGDAGKGAETKSAKNPNGNVLDLALHAATLAGTVRANLAGLSTAKVFADDAARLEAGAAELRAKETAWIAADEASAPGTVARARVALRASRDALYGDIAAYVDDPDGSVAAELKSIGGVQNDDDLESDVGRLVVLARKHAANLAGTELTPALVEQAGVNLQAFETARRGAAGATGRTKAELVAAAHAAAAARNAAYWASINWCASGDGGGFGRIRGYRAGLRRSRRSGSGA
ncbi:MAG: hypothetical protein JWM10_3485 [Myxococcaceae bacterium]|nr:hypothetical protein [Myxococcaceae bacterium]